MPFKDACQKFDKTIGPKCLSECSNCPQSIGQPQGCCQYDRGSYTCRDDGGGGGPADCINISAQPYNIYCTD